MSSHPLPSTGAAPGAHRRPYLACLITGASAMLAGLAIGYALGTVHAYERRLNHKGHHGI